MHGTVTPKFTKPKTISTLINYRVVLSILMRFELSYQASPSAFDYFFSNIHIILTTIIIIIHFVYPQNYISYLIPRCRRISNL